MEGLGKFFNQIKESLLSKLTKPIVTAVPEEDPFVQDDQGRFIRRDYLTPTPSREFPQQQVQAQEPIQQAPVAPMPTMTPMPTPTPEQGELGRYIQQYWPKEELSNVPQVLNGENGSRNPLAENFNTDGSVDRGIFQINSNTFADFMRRKPQVLAQYGITSFDDMFDPEKNVAMAKIIFDEQKWGAWYGAPDELRNGSYLEQYMGE